MTLLEQIKRHYEAHGVPITADQCKAIAYIDYCYAILGYPGFATAITQTIVADYHSRRIYSTCDEPRCTARYSLHGRCTLPADHPGPHLAPDDYEWCEEEQ